MSLLMVEDGVPRVLLAAGVEVGTNVLFMVGVEAGTNVLLKLP